MWPKPKNKILPPDVAFASGLTGSALLLTLTSFERLRFGDSTFLPALRLARAGPDDTSRISNIFPNKATGPARG